jgi:hypothetical protein
MHLYVGVSFWRVHKDAFTKMSVFVLTHQSGLIANYSAGKPRLLRQANVLALDALSFQSLLKVFLGWPLYFFRYRSVLKFLSQASKVLGDPVMESLQQRLLNMGFAQADAHDIKSMPYFVEGFLVRRLDAELIAVFWHTPEISDKSSKTRPLTGITGLRKNNVHALKVPAEKRIQSLSQAFSRWGLYPQVIQGRARSQTGASLPYLVVYDPFQFGNNWSFENVVFCLKQDFSRSKSYLSGHPQGDEAGLQWEFQVDEDVQQRFHMQKASQAYERFLAQLPGPGQLRTI